jgi:hypothetical protein
MPTSWQRNWRPRNADAEGVNLQAAKYHRGVAVLLAARERIDRCCAVQRRDALGPRGGEDRRGSLVQVMAAHAGLVLGPDDGHCAPIVPQALGGVAENALAEPLVVEERHLLARQIDKRKAPHFWLLEDCRCPEHAAQPLEQHGLPPAAASPCQDDNGCALPAACAQGSENAGAKRPDRDAIRQERIDDRSRPGATAHTWGCRR